MSVMRNDDVMRNDELVSSVTDELFWDPKVDSAAIAVSANDGVVALRGTVGSFREKREAENAAKRIHGVELVDNELQVRLLTEARREDADLRGDVLQALMLDSFVPKTVDAKVQDGLVTLTGMVDWQYQRDEAELVASNIVGALDVIDEITLKPRPSTEDVRGSINKAFKRNARLDANLLEVTTSGGTVTITGAVSSWAEHDEAIDAAWTVPGVTRVEDHMTVEY